MFISLYFWKTSSGQRWSRMLEYELTPSEITERVLHVINQYNYIARVLISYGLQTKDFMEMLIEMK